MGYRTKNQGLYTPINPEKYIGDVNNIRFLSSWELHFNKFLDNNVNILAWSSEEISIPYFNPQKGRVSKYYPDYWIKYNNKEGKVTTNIIEVKPFSQTQAPKTRGKNRKTQLHENITWAVNNAKWEAAIAFCAAHGTKFRIITEKELFKGN